MEALQSGRSPQKNNEGKVNVCLVETVEQLVAFGYDSLRFSLGQNASGSTVYWFYSHTTPASNVGFYTDVWRAIFLLVIFFSYSITLKAESVDFVRV